MITARPWPAVAALRTRTVLHPAACRFVSRGTQNFHHNHLQRQLRLRFLHCIHASLLAPCIDELDTYPAITLPPRSNGGGLDPLQAVRRLDEHGQMELSNGIHQGRAVRSAAPHPHA
jgi:hypothetical protein